MNQWITIKDASILVNQSVSTVRRMIKKDPSILTKLENSANGGFRMYLHKEALVKSFGDFNSEEADTETHSLNDILVAANPAPSVDDDSAGVAGEGQRDLKEGYNLENQELKIELERWKCRADEYKNRFEHELLERYRERKMYTQHLSTSLPRNLRERCEQCDRREQSCLWL